MYDLDKDEQTDQWMGVQEAANFLGIHRATLFRAVSNGLIVADHKTPKGRSHFRRETLLAFQETLREQAASSQSHMYAPVQLMAKLANLLTVPGPSKDPGIVFTEILEYLCPPDGPFDKACIAVHTPSLADKFAVRLLAARGISTQFKAAYQCLRPYQDFPLTTTLRTGAPQMCDDIRLHPAQDDTAIRVLKQNGVVSYAVLPLVLGAEPERQTFGALVICGRVAHRFTQQERVFLQGVADALSACMAHGTLPATILAPIETLTPEVALDIASTLLTTAYAQTSRANILPSSVVKVESLCDILVTRSKALATWVEGYGSPPAACGVASPRVLEDKSLQPYHDYLKSLVGRARSVGAPAREQWDSKVTAVALPVPLPSGDLGAVGAVWDGIRKETAAEGIVLSTLASACSLVTDYNPTGE